MFTSDWMPAKACFYNLYESFFYRLCRYIGTWQFWRLYYNRPLWDLYGINPKQIVVLDWLFHLANISARHNHCSYWAKTDARGPTRCCFPFSPRRKIKVSRQISQKLIWIVMCMLCHIVSIRPESVWPNKRVWYHWRNSWQLDGSSLSAKNL